jgi:hypothetical protein
MLALSGHEPKVLGFLVAVVPVWKFFFRWTHFSSGGRNQGYPPPGFPPNSPYFPDFFYQVELTRFELVTF